MTDSERIAAVAAQFPEGCCVRRKSGIACGHMATLAAAGPIKVVMLGVHRDVVLRDDGGMFATYLDPDLYEVMD